MQPVDPQFESLSFLVYYNPPVSGTPDDVIRTALKDFQTKEAHDGVTRYTLTGQHCRLSVTSTFVQVKCISSDVSESGDSLDSLLEILLPAIQKIGILGVSHRYAWKISNFDGPHQSITSKFNKSSAINKLTNILATRLTLFSIHNSLPYEVEFGPYLLEPTTNGTLVRLTARRSNASNDVVGAWRADTMYFTELVLPKLTPLLNSAINA